MKRKHPYLSTYLAAFVAPLLTFAVYAQNGNVKITNKHEFSQQIGNEWIEIDDGVWRLETGAGYTEVGFGKVGANRYISYLNKLKLERQDKGKATTDIENMIIELDAALHSSREGNSINASAGSLSTMSGNSTYPGDLVCGQPWYLEVTTQQGISTFFLASRTIFEPFGPLAPGSVVLKSTSKIVDHSGYTVSDVEFERLQGEQWASANTSASLTTFLGTWESTGSVYNSSCSGWSFDDWAYMKKVGSFQ